jgi:L-asparaginase
MDEQILIIATGGTFDKQYDEITGELTFRSSHLSRIMQVVRCTISYSIKHMALKDSLLMDDADRAEILAACRTSECSQIIIIHGTDTMEITARVLGKADLDKTIILTGAMVPYTVADSDAFFNLGTAVSSVQSLAHGVYISMNGRTLPWDRVRKNRKKGIFEQIEAETPS